MNLDLKDKVALVTGASRGLGREICLLLAAEGAKVVVNYRSSEEKADEVVAGIKEKYGTEAVAIFADMSKSDDITAMFEKIDETFGRIDILINNAAYCSTCQVADMTEEMWNYTLQVNLTGVFICSREFVKRLLESDRRGRIVNISSQIMVILILQALIFEQFILNLLTSSINLLCLNLFHMKRWIYEIHLKEIWI